jgi:rare lipoprotein A
MRPIEHKMKRFVRRLPVLLVATIGAPGLSGCAETQFLVNTAKRLSPHDDSTTAGKYKVGNPYQINGVWYYPRVDYDYVETGIASWYGPNFHGKKTANGETFDANIVSAAHRTLPLPSVVRVTNLDNGRSIRVRVNDRGPFAHGRIIDMSRQASQLLGFYRQGTARVRVEILAQESRQIAAQLGAENTQLARAVSKSDEGKPAITAAPSATITRETLDGAPAAPRARAPQRVARQAEPESGDSVTRVPVEKTNMYVQAGAFADFDNANRLRARLSGLGPARVSQVQIGDQLLFRVRIGPVRDLPAADAMLERVIGAGYGNAQLIVDR